MSTHSEPQSDPFLHTDSFLELIEKHGISLAVSTYQAGSVLILRADRGGLNAQIRNFNQPMGMAIQGSRLAIGTSREVWVFQNVPAVAERLPPTGKHDACFLPRYGHVTGNILVHDLAWRGEELFFVNTRFSCLCALDRGNSFLPVWSPPFISSIAPEDRCHLNGLGFGPEGECAVTALGETDTPKGWRADKRNGGIVIDPIRSQVIARGLSMPHSPRWHAGRLWLLESGTGSLGWMELSTGKYHPICHLPGFTRGLAFLGDHAFVGLSKIRESAVFSDLPVLERGGSLESGVWVVDLRTGEVAGFVRFVSSVDEVFAVELMSGMRFPDIINDDPVVLSGAFQFPTG